MFVAEQWHKPQVTVGGSVESGFLCDVYLHFPASLVSVCHLPTRRTYSPTVSYSPTFLQDIKMAEEANKHLQESLQTTSEGVNDYYDQWGSSGQYDKVGSSE